MIINENYSCIWDKIETPSKIGQPAYGEVRI